MSSTPITTTILGAALALLGAAFALPQPQDGGDPVPVYMSFERAPGVPWYCHVVNTPERGIMLGYYTLDFPRKLRDATAFYVVVATGERVDLPGPVDIEGVPFTPRWPSKGVDATGATVWQCTNAAGEWAPATIILPGVARSADFNGDGPVNTLDFNDFLNAWADQREP